MNFLFRNMFTFLNLFCVVKNQISPFFTPEKDVYFMLRVRNRSFDDDEIFNYENRNAINSSAFDPIKPVTFQIHGFMGSPKMELQKTLSRFVRNFVFPSHLLKLEQLQKYFECC